MTMDSALMRFLQEDYPMHLGLEKGQKVTVQREEYGKGEFDFRDENDKKDEKKEWFSSRIRNESNTPFEVISFEAYIDMLRSDKRVKKEKKDMGKKCDLVFGPVEGRAFIVFNELTYARQKAIDKPFNNPKTGKSECSKRAKAQKQLAESIKRFYEVGGLLDEYEKKIALFSFRLKDNDDKAEENMLSFMKDAKELELDSNIPDNPFPDVHGFTFEQRLYPTPYVIE